MRPAVSTSAVRAHRSRGGSKAGEPSASAGIKALDPETGKTMWDFKIVQGSLQNGVLATAGNVVFCVDSRRQPRRARCEDGQAPLALRNGRDSAASPMSYAVGGRQFVAIAAGNTIYAFALGESSARNAD